MRMDTATTHPDEICRVIRDTAAKNRHIVEIKPYKGHRSLEQNALYYARLKEYALHTGQTMAQARAEVKHNLAAPILAADDPEFARIWRLMTEPLDYQDALKVALMLPMTRKMNTSQMARLNDELAAYAAQSGLIFGV